MEASKALRTARLVSREDAGGGLSLVTLAPPDDLVVKYTHPGQFIELLFGETKGYFALGSNVGASPWELCVRDNGDASTEILRASIGSGIPMRGVLGAGLPVEKAIARSLAIVVVGTAVCVARAIMATRTQHELPMTHVYCGARTRAHLPFAEELARWGHAGARVTYVYSRETREPRESTAAHVQDRVIEDLASDALPKDAVVFSVGPPQIAADLRAKVPDLVMYTNV